MTSALVGRLDARRGPGRLQVAVLTAFATFSAGVLLLALAGHPHPALDVVHSYLPAANAVLDGRSPYAPPGDFSIVSETAYVYPPLLAELVAPLTAVSTGWAELLATVVCVALLLATLWLAGLRDPACYCAVALWSPTFNGAESANGSVLVAFLVALAWRLKDRAGIWRPAAEGVAMAVKPFVWPLAFWEAARGRRWAAVASVAMGVGVAFASWVPIRFAGLGRFVGINREVAEAETARSYSVGGVLDAFGLGRGVALPVSILLAAGLLAACWRVARRGDDVGSLALALAAALVLTPIVWQHYLLILVVPLAVARPKLSPVWLVPIVLWLAPTNGNGAWYQTVLVGAVAATMVAAVLWPTHSARLLARV